MSEEKTKPTVKVVANENLGELVNGNMVRALKGEQIEVQVDRLPALGKLVTKIGAAAKAAAALLVFLVVLLACSLPADAQQYTVTTLLTSTNNIEASQTTNYTAGITVTKHDLVGFAVEFKCLSASTDNVTFTFAKSVDGSNFSTAGNDTLVVAANGTTTVRAVTNFGPTAVGYYRIASIANGTTNTITNIVVKAVTKPRKDG